MGRLSIKSKIWFRFLTKKVRSYNYFIHFCEKSGKFVCRKKSGMKKCMILIYKKNIPSYIKNEILFLNKKFYENKLKHSYYSNVYE